MRLDTNTQTSCNILLIKGRGLIMCVTMGIYLEVTFSCTVWNTVDHLSSLKPQSLVESQNIVVVSVQVPQPKEKTVIQV